ncbi:bromodomain testis-specific protein-like [Drosophila miranda]|uniref:bromodomain testis-specific protein-like n=1 Tax=Drosophila miranda TaxID=7229 RepID=UPI0007E702E3|nr:bromodomain testis-specific protein-like [Drosophila miranda]XP_017140198.1 bromodomain testis-specific protein-like [Drosophila miranda]XP_033245453.1 bromodomain testis-specific protein-like [Drosophila miranda]
MSCDKSAKEHQKMELEVMPKLERMGRHTNKLNWFKNFVIAKIVDKRYASVFLQPIQNPKYYEMIKNPMDIGSIIKRIDNRYYRSYAEAVKDFRIMLENCFKFFGPDDPVYINGMQTANLFLEIMVNRPKGPEIRSTRNPRSATLEMKCRKVAKKRVAEPEMWQSQCWARLSKLRDLSSKLDMPFAYLLVLTKCDILETILSQGHFANHKQFTEELQRSFNGFCNSAIQHILTKGLAYTDSTERPRSEDPDDNYVNSWVSPGHGFSSDPACDRSCSPDSSSSWDSYKGSPTKSAKSNISSSSFICGSSYSDSSDFSFGCSSNELSGDSSD